MVFLAIGRPRQQEQSHMHELLISSRTWDDSDLAVASRYAGEHLPHWGGKAPVRGSLYRGTEQARDRPSKPQSPSTLRSSEKLRARMASTELAVEASVADMMRSLTGDRPLVSSRGVSSRFPWEEKEASDGATAVEAHRDRVAGGRMRVNSWCDSERRREMRSGWRALERGGSDVRAGDRRRVL